MTKMLRWLKVEKIYFFLLAIKSAWLHPRPLFMLASTGPGASISAPVASHGVSLFYFLSKNAQVISLADDQEADFSANSQQPSVWQVPTGKRQARRIPRSAPPPCKHSSFTNDDASWWLWPARCFKELDQRWLNVSLREYWLNPAELQDNSSMISPIWKKSCQFKGGGRGVG